MEYKYELHSHTSEVSPCGRITADDSVMMHKKVGYQGLVITDHFHREFFSSLGDLSWSAKIDSFLKGYRSAVASGIREDIDVLLGFEIRFDDSGNDFLVYGVEDDFLYKHPDLYMADLPYLRRVTDAYGGMLIFQAHPFRKGCRPPEDLSLIDGMEVFNGNPRHNSYNFRARETAVKNALLLLSGSDFHMAEDLGLGGMRLPGRISTQSEMTGALRAVTEENLIIQELQSKGDFSVS